MALFSDIDWVIIAGAAVFLLFGGNNAHVMRTIGRYYGRAMQLKSQLLSEVTRAADLPLPAPGQPTSLRAALFGIDSASTRMSSVPIAVTSPPQLPYRPAIPPSVPWTGEGVLSPTWSMALPSVPGPLAEPEGAR